MFLEELEGFSGLEAGAMSPLIAWKHLLSMNLSYFRGPKAPGGL